MARPLLAIPLIVLLTLALGLPSVLGGLLDPSGRLVHRFARLWARLILRVLGVRVSVSGSHNVPAGPAVFAANHGSALDIPLVFGHLPVEFRIIHKRSLYMLPLIGWILYVGGHIGIDRANAFRARKSLEAAATRIRGGTSVAVFPEGTRSPDGSVGPFKRGSFVLAQSAGVPVVPVSLRGVKHVVPQGLPTLRTGSVELIVHPPVETAGREDADALAEEVRNLVAAGCVEG